MFNLVYSEILKLKKSKTIAFVILSSIFFPVFWFLITPFNCQKQTWVIYTSNSEDIMFMIVAIIVFMLLASYIFIREYSEDTVKLLYSYPVSQIAIFISKILTIYIIIALIYLLHFIIVFGSGLLVIHEPLTKEIFLSHAFAYITSMILEFSLIPLMIFIIKIFKNTTATAFAAVIILVSNFYVYETAQYRYWPFILPYIPIMKVGKAINLMATAGLGITTVVVGMLLCIFQLSRVKDI